jgi:quinol monooxygenase YgiN
MLHVLWEFRVREEHRGEFEGLYGAAGGWARLFQEDPAYLGTDLFRHAERPGVYLTVDRWRSRGAYERFRSDHVAAYQALDALGERLTESEVRIGTVETGDTG